MDSQLKAKEVPILYNQSFRIYKEENLAVAKCYREQRINQSIEFYQRAIQKYCAFECGVHVLIISVPNSNLTTFAWHMFGIILVPKDHQTNIFRLCKL